MEPKVSIIIRCRNNWELTKSCIDSIIANTPKELYRLIVVDDGSTDGTKAYLAHEDYKDVVVFVHSKSMGAVSATNTGLKYVFEHPTPYILIMDNDTEVLYNNTSWLQDMIKCFIPGVGAVGAVSDIVIGQQFVAHINNKEEVKFLISFCMMMSIGCANRVGLWDEQFNPGNSEDLDFSIRARKAGFKLAVARDVFIIHRFHQTFKDIDSIDKLLDTNEQKLMVKWGEKIYREVKSMG